VNAKVTTAVFPVAGMGTRFLPVTKAGPKEMLPLVDKPLIQYVVEEAVCAGITQLVFVTSMGKRAIEDYFDSHYELEHRLEERGKYKELAILKNIVPEGVSIAYVRQPKPLGLGDAVLRAKKIVGDAPFAVLLADDIMDCHPQSCLQSMLDIFNQTQTSVLAVEKVPQKDTNKYGIVSLTENGNTSGRVTAIIEKPQPDVAPSNLAVTGRYILTPRIFSLLENTKQGVGGEIQLTDAISNLLEYEAVTACPFNGKRYDCGNPLGFLEATVAFALRRPDLADEFSEYLKSVIENHELLPN